MLRRVIALIAEPAGDTHEIRIDLPGITSLHLVDSGRLHKVIENLIINALEATRRRPGTLSIAAGTTDQGKPFLSVSDTGEGMSQTFIEENFFIRLPPPSGKASASTLHLSRSSGS